VSIQALLGSPNPDDPLSVDIGKRWKNDEATAVKTATEWTRLYAIPKLKAGPDERSLPIMTRKPIDVGAGLNSRAAADREKQGTSDDPMSESLSQRALSKRPIAPITPPHVRCDGVFMYANLQPIDEIRLLRLHPGSNDDALTGTIENVLLPICSDYDSETELPGCAGREDVQIRSYEAVSYAWGNPRVTDTIYLHNDHSEATLSLAIASNCAQALRRLRHVDEERLLWIDAICINQADVVERSAQVRMMHRIYKTASRVLVYLGESSFDSDIAISILEDDANGNSQFVTNSLDENETLALKSFFNRQWFNRVWVLQEVAWSKSTLVICGLRATSWRETIHKAYSSSIGHVKVLQPLPYVMSFGKPRPNNTMAPGTILRELRNARDCDASDARDKIYALLELFQQRPDDKRLTIDYSRDVSGLYTDVTEYLLENMGINVLSERYMHDQDDDDNIPGLPSWVIDWTVSSAVKPSEFRGCHAGGQGSSGLTFTVSREKGLSDWMAKNREEPLRPRVSKFLPSRVADRSSSPFWLDRSPLEHRSFEKHSQQRGIKVRAACLGFVGGIHLRFTRDNSGFYGFERQLEEFLRWGSPAYILAFEQLLDYITHVETSSLEHITFERKGKGTHEKWSDKRTKQVLSKLQNRVFLITKAGLPALGPLHAQWDDKIFVLEGGDMCYVLRRTDTSGIYTLVGDCFLFGHMQTRSVPAQIFRYCPKDDGVDEFISVPWEAINVV